MGRCMITYAAAAAVVQKPGEGSVSLAARATFGVPPNNPMLGYDGIVRGIVQGEMSPHCAS